MGDICCVHSYSYLKKLKKRFQRKTTRKTSGHKILKFGLKLTEKTTSNTTHGQNSHSCISSVVAVNGYLFNTSANWLLYNCVKREKRRFGKVLTVYFRGAVYDRFMNNKSVYKTSYRDLLNVINLYMWFPKGSKIWWKGTIVWFLGVFGFVPI